MDGLNVAIPFQDENYYEARPTISIPRPGRANGAINLDGQFGLHPAMADLIPFWKSGQLALIHSSGSPNPTRSHFDAQDYMESGTPTNKTTPTGWMNRLLTQLPRASTTKAINIGPTTPRILAGPQATSNVQPKRQGLPKLAIDQEPVQDIFNQLYQGNGVLASTYREGVQSRDLIRQGLNREMMSSAKGSPTPDYLSRNVSSIVKLLRGPTQTQLMFLSLGGWDTHVNQGSTSGQFTNRVIPLASGLSLLAKSLGQTFNETVIVVMSEFGRTVKENGNGGTDHGHGNLMMVLGGGVSGGQVYGEWNGLQEDSLREGRDLPVTTDFRDILAPTISRHFNLNAAAIAQIFPGYRAKNPITLI